MADSTEVLVGLPDQKTTGAIMSAPLGTPLPTSATDTPDSAFGSSGYVSEDGLSLGTDFSTNDIKEWGGSIVRKILEQFDGTLSWKEISLSYESACNAFGAEHVEHTEADTEHGDQIKISIGAHLPEARSWIFRMKDGDVRILVVVPNGQVTSIDSIEFNSADPIGFPVSLSCYPDENGECIYIYVDNGKKADA